MSVVTSSTSSTCSPNDDPPEKVTDHAHVSPDGESEAEAIRDATGEEGEDPCAHKGEDEEHDCGKDKRLHRR